MNLGNQIETNQLRGQGCYSYPSEVPAPSGVKSNLCRVSQLAVTNQQLIQTLLSEMGISQPGKAIAKQSSTTLASSIADLGEMLAESNSDLEAALRHISN